MPAVITIAAGDVVEDHDPVAELIIGNIVTERGDDPGGLMSKDARRRVRAGGDLLQIGAADAAGVDPDQDLARRRSAAPEPSPAGRR